MDNLQTKRLTLRKIKLEDAKTLYNNIFSNFEDYKFYYQQEFENYDEYETVIKRYQLWYQEGSHFIWGISKKDNDEIIGIVLLHGKDSVNLSCKIGFIIDGINRNNGYAKEAVQAVINFCFKKLRYHRIEANIVSENINSIRLVKSLGMKYEATKKESYKIKDRYYDQDVYVLLNK